MHTKKTKMYTQTKQTPTEVRKIIGKKHQTHPHTHTHLLDAHLPHILGGVGLVKGKVDRLICALTLNAEVTLVVDQVGDVVPPV